MAQEMADATANLCCCFFIANATTSNMGVSLYTPKQILGAAHICEYLNTPLSLLAHKTRFSLHGAKMESCTGAASSALTSFGDLDCIGKHAHIYMYMYTNT
jgi:hypothetical protein